MVNAQDIQTALHARTSLAFQAAREQDLPGTFESWKTGSGIFANVVSDPELRFLSTIVATGAPDIDDLWDTLADPRWDGIAPGIVLYGDPEPALDDFLGDAGFTLMGWRPVAVRALSADDRDADPDDVLQVERIADDQLDEFIAVLLNGYQVNGPVARFIESEHRNGDLLRFAVRDGGRMIAVSGMTIHGPSAVIGGAATLPEDRGRGAQSALLRHRLGVAGRVGCSQAVATAAYESPSARNLAKAGFTVLNRRSWHKPV
jgi:GNAT superfamily N-acetyltransferase